MLERCALCPLPYNRFTKALDLDSHPILLATLDASRLSDSVMNWIIYYLKDRCHVIKCNGTLSSSEQIDTGVVKGSDDTNLLVPADTDLDLAQKFHNIKHWLMKIKW